MTALVLDAGALIALDRNSRSVWADFNAAIESGIVVHVPVGEIGQVWRDDQRQVRLARALKSCREVTLDGEAARAAGVLCGQTGTTDVIDASVARVAEKASAQEGVVLYTSDVEDLELLLSTLNAAAIKVVKV